ncbi:MAG: type IV pilin, partial [Methanomicrobiales archaeon]|nr:type IV pilin [Methanomicrobiales archaeon]
MNMIKLRENEEAVSPVIGVILMVAITVILAAVIAAFVFGMGSGVETQKQIAINAKQIAGSELQVTVQGGTDLSSLKYLRVNIDDTSYYAYVEGSERKFSSTATA